MQRRAAAMYFVFFLVIGAGAYGFITVVDAQRPGISIEGETHSQNDVLTVGGETYVITGISAEEESGGAHGGGGGTVMAGEITWTNESARETATLENDSSVTYQNVSWTVSIENRTDVSEFTLREELNVTEILSNDPAVEDETAEFQGEPHVVYRDNGSLVPVDQYLPAPETTTFAEGDGIRYDGNDATVFNVTTSEARVEWTFTQENTIDLSEGANITLGDGQYLVHFPNQETVTLSQDFEGYQASEDRQAYFQERKNGLWGVSIVSFAAAIILLGAAFMPVKD